MIRSMTGFARAEQDAEFGQLVLELRTVNHRYLDIMLRLPEELRVADNALRERIRRRLARGKVDCTVRFQPATGADSLQVDEPRAQALIRTLEQVEEWMKNPARIPAIEILRWPGVLQEQPLDQDALVAALTALLDQALDRLIAVREQEGARLREFLLQRLARVAEIVEQVRARRVAVVQAIRDKMLARLRELQLDVDEGRLEQELALIAQKLDVEEELDRLQAHVAAARQALDGDEPVGRRLDFLMQEFNREANTLSAKAADSETTRAAVELKVLIEQMREQVQNIE